MRHYTLLFYGLVATALALSVVPGSARISAAQTATTKAQDDTEISPRERAFIASKMYSAIGAYFAHFQAVPDFDLDASYSMFLDAAFQAPGRYEFDLACLEFIAKLKNGHSGFGDRWLSDTRGQSFGFYATFVENQWVVTYSRIPEVKVGDVLRNMDDRTVEAFFAEKKKYVAASNERAARTNFFRHRYLFPPEFSLTTADGKKHTIRRLPPLSVEEATTGKWLVEKKVAYIKIPGFGDPKFEADAVKWVAEFRDAATLIIDLRGNGGGSSPSRLIDALMDRPYRVQAQATPIHVAVWQVRGGFFDDLQKDPKAPRDGTYGYLEAMKDVGSNAMFVQPSFPIKPQEPLFKGKVVVLIDREVASAAEDFCIPFKDNGRARFLGETTFGSTGQPYLHQFANGMNFRVSAKRDSFPDGSPFEGVGIVPDIEIPTTIEGLRSGKDAVLDTALAPAR